MERENTEFAIVMFDLRRARIARRLHERHLAGDFDGKSDEEAARVRGALSDVHRATEIVRQYASTVEETKRLLESATLAVKSAQRAFRREVQDHPASSVHLDALQALYQRQDAVARTVEEAASKKIPVFPQGLDDRWWGFLVLARAKRATLERELRDAKDAHARTTEKMRALEANAREMADIADRHERDRKTAQSARWTRAHDVDCTAHLDRGYVEIPSKSTADALERDDVILVPKARVDAINAKLRESYAAKARAERANAKTRDEIERVKWETRVLRLRCEDRRRPRRRSRPPPREQASSNLPLPHRPSGLIQRGVRSNARGHQRSRGHRRASRPQRASSRRQDVSRASRRSTIYASLARVFVASSTARAPFSRARSRRDDDLYFLPP